MPEPDPITEANTVLREAVAARGLAIGQVLIGRYEVRKIIGRGAMGEVLEVRDQQSGVDYALKRVPPDLVRNAAQMAGIRVNFALVSQLTHPHIGTTRQLELDPASGHAYLLMDLVRGIDLAQWLIKKRQELGNPNAPLPIELALGIAEQIAAALDYAHNLPVSHGSDGKPKVFGILHRDLKPANIMLESEREYRPGVPFVRIIDFGLAAEIQASLQSLSVKRQNELSGTPAYMAPEQWEGRTLTRGVDQWSLAVMIYEMVAGRRPFEGPSEVAIMTQICKADPEQPTTLTDAQWAVLKKTLQPDRKQRHPSCTEMVKALADADSSTAGKVAPAGTPLAKSPDLVIGKDVNPSACTGSPEEFGERESKHQQAVKTRGRLVMGLVALVVLALLGGGYFGWQWLGKPQRDAEKEKKNPPPNVLSDERYDQLINAGDAALRERKWLVAKGYYNEVLKQRENDKIALHGLESAQTGFCNEYRDLGY